MIFQGGAMLVLYTLDQAQTAPSTQGQSPLSSEVPGTC